MKHKNLEYKILRNNLNVGETAIVLSEITDSKDFDLNELSHIVLKGTKTLVGYIGDDSLELVNPNKKEFIKYHNKLKEIFNHTLMNHY